MIAMLVSIAVLTVEEPSKTVQVSPGLWRLPVFEFITLPRMTIQHDFRR